MGATFDPLLGKLRTTDSGGSNTYNITNNLKIDQAGGTSDTYGALSGTVDGSNKLYTVSSAKYNTGSLTVYLNGQLLTQGTAEDWVETSATAGTFTLANAPYVGDQITAAYMVGSGGGSVFITSLSTTGTTGPATVASGVLNIPQYSGGGITRSINSISTATTAGATASTDYVYLVSSTTTLTLPTAVSNTNKYTVKNSGANTVTIATTSSQTIDGSTTVTLVPNQSLDIISDSANWRLI